MSEDGKTREILIANVRLRAGEVAGVSPEAFATVMDSRLVELDYLLEDLADVVMGRVERSRSARLAALIEEHRDVLADSSSLDGCSDADRYLLVERNTYSGRMWLTTHATPEAAAGYRDTQEYPEDWASATLVDLDSGDELVPTTIWERAT